MKSNYIFVGDRIDFEGSDQFNLGFNHIIRRPNKLEIEEIRKQLKSYFEVTGASYFNRYEQFKQKISETQSNVIRIDNDDEFKYAVIQEPINWLSYYDSIGLTLNISEFDMTQIFNYQYATQNNSETGETELSKYGGAGRKLSMSMYNYFDMNVSDFSKKTINKEISEDIENLHSEVFAFLEKKEEFPHIFKVITDFSAHKEISRKSPFKLIVLLASLEGLVADGSHDRVTSINRQLQSKLNLINNRCGNSVDFTEYIKGPNTLTFEKILESIYSYRSKIAHGDFIEFKRSLAILENVDFDLIIDFVLKLSKKVIRFAINEPELITDLKKI